jgi:hypothetical protein
MLVYDTKFYYPGLYQGQHKQKHTHIQTYVIYRYKLLASCCILQLIMFTERIASPVKNFIEQFTEK